MNELAEDVDLTLAERAAHRLQRDILSGVYAPGDRLRVVELAQQYEIGSTPVREGLSRLLSQGLIVAIGRRGFRVSEISREDLVDLTAVRTLVELDALRRSMESGDDAWESEVVASLHRLRNSIRRAGSTTLEGAPDYDEAHKAFHMSMLAACGSARLLEMASTLYDQAYRYRILMMKKHVDPDVRVRVHQDLADVALARDFPRARELLKAHLETTLGSIYPEPVQ